MREKMHRKFLFLDQSGLMQFFNNQEQRQSFFNTTHLILLNKLKQDIIISMYVNS